jgi:hypothetical protein
MLRLTAPLHQSRSITEIMTNRYKVGICLFDALQRISHALIQSKCEMLILFIDKNFEWCTCINCMLSPIC